MRGVERKLDKDQATWFFTICWILWTSSNQTLMEDAKENPVDAMRLLLAFDKRTKRHTNIPGKKFFQGITVVDHAEALASQSAIELAVEHGWNKVVLGGDGLGIIQCI
ncbi:hypothetical protein Salat_2127600 [Sesamum alatum]|uniref:Uncharacterized protein n=1 Tax=Sesamum alatum TaxID=300844 RepID=A0AAE1Y145_9LAMI|nr:hypothetical protein Salat_2127600 [Sesamum alatum]